MKAKRSLARAELMYWAWRGQPLRDVALQLISQSQGADDVAASRPTSRPALGTVVSVSCRAWDVAAAPAASASLVAEAASPESGGGQAEGSAVPRLSRGAPSPSPEGPRGDAGGMWTVDEGQASSGLREGPTGGLWKAPSAPSVSGWHFRTVWGMRKNPEYDSVHPRLSQAQPRGALRSWVSAGNTRGAGHSREPNADKGRLQSRQAAALAEYEENLESLLGVRLSARVQPPGVAPARKAGAADSGVVPLVLDRSLRTLERALTARLWYLRAGLPSSEAARGVAAVEDATVLKAADVAAATACVIIFQMCATSPHTLVVSPPFLPCAPCSSEAGAGGPEMSVALRCTQMDPRAAGERRGLLLREHRLRQVKHAHALTVCELLASPRRVPRVLHEAAPGDIAAVRYSGDSHMRGGAHFSKIAHGDGRFAAVQLLLLCLRVQL